jgi:hypothetical protein
VGSPSIEREFADSEFVGSEATRPGRGGDGDGRGPAAATGTGIAALPAASVVGPLGLEPRTCGLRVWCEGAGQRAVRLLSWAIAPQ